MSACVRVRTHVQPVLDQGVLLGVYSVRDQGVLLGVQSVRGRAYCR